MLRDARMQITALCAPLPTDDDPKQHQYLRVDEPRGLPYPVYPRSVSKAWQVQQPSYANESLLNPLAVATGYAYREQEEPSVPLVIVGPPPPPAPRARRSSNSSRMTNSTRGKLYRSRRKKYTDGLAEYVEKLRKEVEELQIYHQTQQAMLVHTQRNPDTTSSFARIVCEYFSLFEFGVPVVADGGAISRDALVRSSRQARFLDAMMDPHMAFGGTRGVQLLLDQWERYSMYHAKLQFRLNSINVVVADGENPVISANAVLRVRFSRFTIQKVFPHILWNEALVQRLISLDAVEYPVGNTFYFGPDGKIHGYETEVDFVDAFLRALGSIHDAIELVGHALIKQQHMIGEAEEEESGEHVGPW
ncbi:hypothetical protein FI667_g15088, partial [Globisporangium splendens]